eukprot:m.36788 g.36788  ORF g.36788 m.36788 type:complete len:302 (+) comp5408_c0_seq3:1767-2672(+)
MHTCAEEPMPSRSRSTPRSAAATSATTARRPAATAPRSSSLATCSRPLICRSPILPVFKLPNFWRSMARFSSSPSTARSPSRSLRSRDPANHLQRPNSSSSGRSNSNNNSSNTSPASSSSLRIHTSRVSRPTAAALRARLRRPAPRPPAGTRASAAARPMPRPGRRMCLTVRARVRTVALHRSHAVPRMAALSFLPCQARAQPHLPPQPHMQLPPVMLHRPAMHRPATHSRAMLRPAMRKPAMYNLARPALPARRWCGVRPHRRSTRQLLPTTSSTTSCCCRSRETASHDCIACHQSAPSL